MEIISEYYGYFLYNLFPAIAGCVVVASGLGFFAAPFWLWTIGLAVAFLGFGAPTAAFIGLGVVGTLFNVKPLRRAFISTPILNLVRRLGLLPKISETEKAALDAGAVWVEAEFFSGKPNYTRILSEDYPKLTPEEQAYLDGPINELCKRIDDWKIYQDKDIPRDVWDYMKEIKIFGMIIPKKYGGLEFSALAHSEVIMKLSSRSLPITITAMVPNSLGPAELLNHFGTEEQKDYYLPRLATGEEIPCFALTEPRAGSDAGSIESDGVVFMKEGKLFVRLNWNKRWITLAAISTVLGLAFRLRDPQHLLGGDEEVGITCALIPSNTKGVKLGRRHDPLGVPFYNCPTQGVNVEIPIDWIIGGQRNVGRGWGMLMESLGAGRGISLPSQSVGGAKLIARVTSAHSSVRKQFGLALAKLEGIEEPLARIGAYTYTLDAMRKYTLGALDRGIKPSVVTAMAKFNSTEILRKAINDGMDIMAGTGISRGPGNLLANVHAATPIGITVEGANILTRTLIIFGQGLFRAHPWAYKEVDSAEHGDKKGFDEAIWGHCGHLVSTFFRVLVHNATRGFFAPVSKAGELGRYQQKFSWASANFALLADVAMGSYGGSLKAREKITGRFADIISWLYMSAAVLRRFEAEGSPKEDLPYVRFSLKLALTEIQQAFDGIYANIKVPGLSWFFKSFVRTFARMNRFDTGISDKLGHEVATALLTRGRSRDRLCEGIYYPDNKKEALGRLENAYNLVKSAEEVERKISTAIRQRKLPKDRIYKLIELAKERGIVDEEEVRILSEVASARWEACQVDDFSEEAYHGVDEKSNKVFRDDYEGPAGAPQFYKRVA